MNNVYYKKNYYFDESPLNRLEYQKGKILV